jgi:hypothetical protein
LLVVVAEVVVWARPMVGVPEAVVRADIELMVLMILLLLLPLLVELPLVLEVLVAVVVSEERVGVFLIFLLLPQVAAAVEARAM